MNKINTYDYLKDFERIHVKIKDGLFCKIKNKIKSDYGSIGKFNEKYLKMNMKTLQFEFWKNAYHPFYRILIITKSLNISKNELYSDILGFYHWGSHNNCEVKIPIDLTIDEFFVEGYALYLAEGDTGFSGRARPRKFRFTNANVNVVNHMISWFSKYFAGLPSYILVHIPIENENLDYSYIKALINHNELRFVKGHYNKIVKYNLFCYRAVFID